MVGVTSSVCPWAASLLYDAVRSGDGPGDMGAASTNLTAPPAHGSDMRIGRFCLSLSVLFGSGVGGLGRLISVAYYLSGLCLSFPLPPVHRPCAADVIHHDRLRVELAVLCHCPWAPAKDIAVDHFLRRC